MTPRNVLALMIAAFFAASLLLIYNGYYKPIDAASLAKQAVCCGLSAS